MPRAHARHLGFPPGGVRAQVRLSRSCRRDQVIDGPDGPDGTDGPDGPRRTGQLTSSHPAAAVAEDDPVPAPGGIHHAHRRPRRPITRGKLALIGLGAGLAATVLAGVVAGFLPALMQPVARDGAVSGTSLGAGVKQVPAAADTSSAGSPVTAGVRDWVLANLEPATPLLVPDEVAGDLVRHGHQAGRLIVYSSSRSVADWQCCSFLVTVAATAAAAGQTLPPQLRPAWERSRVLAVFTSADRRGEIREIFSGDPKAARAAFAADRTVRQDLAVGLAGNPRLRLTPAARAAMMAGHVDTRILVALAGVVRTHDVTVTEFPAHPGEATTGVPRRAVHITSVDGRPVHPKAPGTKDVQRHLLKQVPPYRPHALPIGRDGSGHMLTICFRAPEPIGLRVPSLA